MRSKVRSFHGTGRWLYGQKRRKAMRLGSRDPLKNTYTAFLEHLWASRNLSREKTSKQPNKGKIICFNWRPVDRLVHPSRRTRTRAVRTAGRRRRTRWSFAGKRCTCWSCRWWRCPWSSRGWGAWTARLAGSWPASRRAPWERCCTCPGRGTRGTESAGIPSGTSRGTRAVARLLLPRRPCARQQARQITMWLPSKPLTLDLMETLDLFFRRACYHWNASYIKRKRIKVGEKL